MSGSLGDMGNLLRQAQEMQRELDRVREELRSRTVEGTAGAGAVRIEITADRQEVKGVEIAPEILARGDAALIEGLVASALRDGLRRAETLANESMSKVTGGMNLPGLF